ncbi:type II secretion system F family protein [bacterium]|nr:type II secretion system F family protein [bacterium]
MASFTYVAKDRAGVEVTGILSGGNIDEIVGQLHGDGLAVLHVTEDRGAASTKSWLKRFSEISFGKVPTREVALFSRQLATVIDSGIPLVKGLKGLAGDGSNKMLKNAVEDMSNRLARGESLSEAMAEHPNAFNSMYMSMIRAGERAGTLDKIVEQLAVYLEKIDDIQGKVKSALSYPLFVLGFATLGTLFLLLKIVPTFSEIYAELGQDLPGLTQLVMTISNTIGKNLLASLGVVLALIVGFVMVSRTDGGRYLLDRLKLKLPIFGPVLEKTVMSRFARTMGILIGSGLPLLESLDLVKGAAGNAYVSRALDDVKESVTAGHGVTESFRATGVFPEMTLQLMATGEEAGELDTMLVKSSDFYDRQVEATIQGIASLIEPIMIVLVGGMIGFIVVAMFLPIFGMGDAMMKGATGM